MNRLTILICFVFSTLTLFADTYSYEVAGEWKDQANWDTYPGQTIADTDTVIINADLTTDGATTINGVIINNDSAKFTIFFWMFNINGKFINNGNFVNNGAVNLFGEAINNAKWTNDISGNFDIVGAAIFFSYGTLVNNSSISAYLDSYFLIAGPFTNNGGFQVNSDLNIKLLPGDKFINNGTCICHGNIRLEGELDINPFHSFTVGFSGILTIADNSTLINNGTVNVATCYMSSQMESETILGHFVVGDNLYVQASIPEIL